MAEAGGSGQGYQQTAKLSELTERVVEGAFEGLKNVLDGLPSRPDKDRGKELLQYFHDTKQKLLRLRMAAQWANKAKAVHACAQAWGVASGHSDSFRFAADHMAYLHEELMHLATPAYSVHTAWEVLTTGSYNQLPSVIQEICPPKPLTQRERHRSLRQINFLIHSHLDGIVLPTGVKLVDVSKGVATFRCKGEYEAKVTLVPAPPHIMSIPRVGQEQNQHTENTKNKSQAEGSKTDGLVGTSNGILDGMDEVVVKDPGGGVKKDRGRKKEEWWWRLMELKLFPGSSKGPPLEPIQVEELKQELDIRMCMTAESLAMQARINSNKHAGTTSTEASKPDPPHPHVNGAKIKVRVCPDKRTKAKADKDKVKTPDEESWEALQSMHTILRDISRRLLLSVIRKECKALVCKGAVWERRAKLALAGVLRPGYRMYYWLDTPVITDEMLDGKQSENIRSPYFEIGTSKGGRVKVKHFPDLPKKHVKEPQDLKLDPFTVDVEMVLLKAAATNSQIIMGVLFEALQRRMAGDGSKEFKIWYWKEYLDCLKSADHHHGARELDVQFGPKDFGSPLIQCFGEGNLLLKVTLHLHSGRLLLEVGPNIKAQMNTELAKGLRMEEDRVNQFWRRWSREPAVSPKVVPTVTALDKVANKLAILLRNLQQLCYVNMQLPFLFAAKRMNLEPSPLTINQRMFDDYKAAHPECCIKQQNVQLTLPSTPLPKRFPEFRHAKLQSHVKDRQGRTVPLIRPRGIKDIRCYLNISLDADDNDQKYSLIVLGVDECGTPIEIVKCLPVPCTSQNVVVENKALDWPASRGGKVKVIAKIKPKAKRKRVQDEPLEFEDGKVSKAKKCNDKSKIAVLPSTLSESLDGVLEDVDMGDMLLDDRDPDMPERDADMEDLLVDDQDEDILVGEENGECAMENGDVRAEKTGKEERDPTQDALCWCQERATWESLTVQLNALKIPFLEEMKPMGGDICHRLRLVGWRPFKQSIQHKDPKIGGTLQGDLRFGFSGLEYVTLEVPRGVGGLGQWTAKIGAKQLAWFRGQKKFEFWNCNVDANSEGVELRYSPGDTVLTLLRDLRRIAAAQEFVSSLKSQCQLQEGSCWEWPSTGRVKVSEIGLSNVEFQVEGTKTEAGGEVDNTWSVGYIAEWLPESAVRQREREGYRIERKREGKLKTEEEILQEKKMVERRIEEENAQEYNMVCRVRASSPIPSSVLDELGVMAQAQESGLFLDAICITSRHLLDIRKSLQPEVLQSAKLQPGSVTLIPSAPPYKFVILINRGDKRVSAELQLFSRGVAYVALDKSGVGSTVDVTSQARNNGSAQGDEVSSAKLDAIPGVQRFLEEASQMAGVEVSKKEGLVQGLVEGLSGNGVWCQPGKLPEILALLIRSLGQC